MKLTGQTYTQEPHCCAMEDAEPMVKMTIEDGGDGRYLVLNASDWAMNDDAEIDALCEAMKEMLRRAA